VSETVVAQSGLVRPAPAYGWHAALPRDCAIARRKWLLRSTAVMHHLPARLSTVSTRSLTFWVPLPLRQARSVQFEALDRGKYYRHDEKRVDAEAWQRSSRR
jgi:hypothetical protein